MVTYGHYVTTTGRLSKHDHDGNKNVTNLHSWQWETVVLHALHVQFSFLYISMLFSSFPRRVMTCFAVVWTTWAWYGDNFQCFLSFFISQRLIPIWFPDIQNTFYKHNDLEQLSCLLKLPNTNKKISIKWFFLFGKINRKTNSRRICHINRLLHRKCAVRIFIHELQNFRNERVSF